MHLLIITHIFWPEGADYKNYVLAKEFVKRGHKVTVLAPFPNYPLGRIYDGYKQSWRQWEHVDNIEILRVPLYPKHSSSTFERVLNYMSFTLSASTIGLLLLRKKIDVVFVYSPPMTLGWPAWLFKIFNNAPVLLDVVDLWPEAVIGSGMVTSNWITRVTRGIANSAYCVSSKITVLSSGYSNNLIKNGVSSTKIEVIPPWADSKIFYKATPDYEFGEKFNIQNTFNIIYTGNIGPFQDFRNIINAAVLLKEIDSLRFILVGEGRDKLLIKQLVIENGLNNVVMPGAYPKESMSGIMAWAGALLITLRNDPYLEINIPSKICAYMATQRPILVCAQGESANIVNDAKIGLTCPPGKPEKLAETVMKFMAISKQERTSMEQRSKQLFVRRYDMKIGIDRYVNLIESLRKKSS